MPFERTTVSIVFDVVSCDITTIKIILVVLPRHRNTIYIVLVVVSRYRTTIYIVFVVIPIDRTRKKIIFVVLFLETVNFPVRKGGKNSRPEGAPLWLRLYIPQIFEKLCFQTPFTRKWNLRRICVGHLYYALLCVGSNRILTALSAKGFIEHLLGSVDNNFTPRNYEHHYLQLLRSHLVYYKLFNRTTDLLDQYITCFSHYSWQYLFIQRNLFGEVTEKVHFRYKNSDTMFLIKTLGVTIVNYFTSSFTNNCMYQRK